MEKEKRLRGYVFSREADGQFVPQRLQNMFLRDYVESKKCKFLLSTVEYYMDNCYMMLESQLDQIDAMDGIAFFSMTFLPEDKEKRKALYNRFLEKGKELHFALENLSVTKASDVEQLEEIIAIRDLTKHKEAVPPLV